MARNKTPRRARASSGRFASGSAAPSGLAVALGAGVLAVGAALFGRWFSARRPGAAGHAAPDLAADQPAPGTGDRAPPAFRPDIDAPMTPAEREALRPATGPAPSLEDRGAVRSS